MSPVGLLGTTANGHNLIIIFGIGNEHGLDTLGLSWLHQGRRSGVVTWNWFLKRTLTTKMPSPNSCTNLFFLHRLCVQHCSVALRPWLKRVETMRNIPCFAAPDLPGSGETTEPTGCIATPK